MSYFDTGDIEMQKGMCSLILQLYRSTMCAARNVDRWIDALVKRAYRNIDSIDSSPEWSVNGKGRDRAICKAMLGGVYCLRHESYEPWYAHT